MAVMEIMLNKDVNGDGFMCVVQDDYGNVLSEQQYYYNQNISYTPDSYLPYVDDVLRDTLNEYGLGIENIYVSAGTDEETGSIIRSDFVDDFIYNHVNNL